MNNLSPQNIKKLEKLAKVLDGGDIELLAQLNELEEKVEQVQSTVDETIQIAKETKKMKGDDGYTPIKGKDYFDGEDGDNYVLTEQDKKEIAQSIPVPIVEKVIEKTVVREVPGETIIREIPIVTNEIKEVATLDDAIVSYLEDEIKRVEEKIKEEPRVTYRGGTIGKNQVYGFIEQFISNFPVTGTTRYAYRAISALRTLDITDNQIECTANSFTVTLPTAIGITGRVYSLKNSGTGIITIATTGGQTIDGKITQSLTQYDNIKVFSNGANWIII